MKGNVHSTVNLGKITVGHRAGRLVADTNLEPSRAPVDELHSALRLKRGHRSVCILGNDIATVQEATGHVLSIPGIAANHLVVGLEARHGDLLHRVGLVRRLGRGDDRGISRQREVDAGIRHQVRLEFGQIDIEQPIESEGGSNGRDNCIESDTPSSNTLQKSYLEQSDGSSSRSWVAQCPGYGGRYRKWPHCRP